MYRVIVFAAVSALALLPLCGQELIYAPGKTMGLENVPPPERNRWKARIVRPVDYDRNGTSDLLLSAVASPKQEMLLVFDRTATNLVYTLLATTITEQ